MLDVICFGNLISDTRFLIDKYPVENKGTFINKTISTLGGDAAIIANNLKVLGVEKVGLLGSGIANDVLGNQLLLLLDNLGIYHSINKCYKKTPYAHVYLSRKLGTRTWFVEGMQYHLKKETLFNYTLIDKHRVCYIDSWFGKHSKKMLELVNHYQPTIVLHGGPWMDKGLLKFAHIIIRSNADLNFSIDQIKNILLDDLRLGIKLSIVTDGSNGCFFGIEKKIYRLDGFNVETIDSTGAGATFTSGLIYGYLNGAKLIQLPVWGNALAALKIQMLGNLKTPFSLEELNTFLLKFSYEELH